MKRSSIGNTGIDLPSIVFGTSALGNLYNALTEDTKLEIVSECFKYVPKPVVFDCAGKYGAGLALEMLGKCLSKLGVKEEEVIISNKLGWLRKDLTTPEPTFEPGVWRNLKHDAYMDISSEGILKCFEQGNELLGGKYKPQLLSIHDPDEYINMGHTPGEMEKRIKDIIDGYQTLLKLKKEGKVKAVGIGAKDWRIIQMLASKIDFDWVMFANSFTIMQHPAELFNFMQSLSNKGVSIINSAVFHGGFLLGSDYFDYKLKSANQEEDKSLYDWRNKFLTLCRKYSLSPSNVCVNYGMTAPGVRAIALNTSKPQHVRKNVEAVTCSIPAEFYQNMKELNLI